MNRGYSMVREPKNRWIAVFADLVHFRITAKCADKICILPHYRALLFAIQSMILLRCAHPHRNGSSGKASGKERAYVSG